MNVAQDAERAGAHGGYVEAEAGQRQHGRESGRGREEDLEGGAFVGLALDGDGAAMLLDDAPGDEQAQAGAVGFGGEERLEQARHVLGRDADAVVLDREPELRAGQRPSAGLAGAAPGGRRSVATERVPFGPIASRAFRNRFTKACCNW